MIASDYHGKGAASLSLSLPLTSPFLYIDPLLHRRKMVALVSRHGRSLQRYRAGRRLVVGCIPYKFKIDQALEVLVISSQKGPELMFPKGGWELDETLPAAAAREAFEEAGVTGNFEGELGKWLSEDRDKVHYMFAMRATEVLQQWPEMSRRERKWVTVAEARQVCKHPWMREALERLEELVSSGSRQEPRGGGGGLTALTVNSSL
ncbi:nudix hydrolase 17, mitochondrial-like [Zingiber officinale]|uniref:nudix hydrolase 17, mitochondrial-like n=1 Tax=Zingiber officinale TaxID=94328 RepID=UPI001C4CDD09|nr:nudix hydrolase 17, mitochondrial-like [Zingiber officinale]